MSPAIPPVAKKEKILIIESDSAFGEKIQDALKKEGYATTLVKNGTDGLKTIFDILPHLIILDTTLPGTDGYEVLKKKNTEPLLQKIPVFLLSSQGLPISMQKVPQGSVAEYIITFQADVADIVEKVNKNFNRGPSEVSGKGLKKVLWVEDDKLIGTILSKKLVNSGFDLFHAQNGEQAMEMLKSLVPDVIVMDLLLPGMSGFDIIQRMKSEPATASIPVMILSNMNKASDIERARVMGVKKYLVKASNSLDQIVDEIRVLVR